jgi:hypothetical protein
MDERKEATLIHDGRRHQDMGHLFIMNFEGTKILISIVCFYVWVCFFVWRFMVFEVCNSMEMSFEIGFGDGTGLLLQLGWLLNEK